jgi:hypothetical protein
VLVDKVPRPLFLVGQRFIFAELMNHPKDFTLKVFNPAKRAAGQRLKMVLLDHDGVFIQKSRSRKKKYISL